MVDQVDANDAADQEDTADEMMVNVTEHAGELLKLWLIRWMPNRLQHVGILEYMKTSLFLLRFCSKLSCLE